MPHMDALGGRGANAPERATQEYNSTSGHGCQARPLGWAEARVGLSMMCYTLGKEKRMVLGDFQLSGRIGKLL